MKRLLEKMSLLALSLMLISSFSISSASPLMLKHFKAYSPDKVELLISVPSFFVIVMLLLNKQLNRYLKERQIITIGLLTMSIAGLVPFFNQNYTIILVSRMFFGLGTGMINAKAISIISENFRGHERVQMLGLRGSAEVVGSAFLTLLVGRLIRIDWHYAFLVYGFGFVILLAYLFFVPKKSEKSPQDTNGTPIPLANQNLSETLFERHSESEITVVEEKEQDSTIPMGSLAQIILMAVVAGWSICINSSINLRIPVIVTNLGIGDGSDASFILMLQQLIGIVAGVTFAPLLEGLKQKLLPFSMIGLGIFLFGVALSVRFSPLGIATIGTGFFYSLIVTTIFYRLAEIVPSAKLNNATAMVLLGCNLGSALSPYVLKVLGVVSETGFFVFSFYALTCFLIAGLTKVYQKFWLEADVAVEIEDELDAN